MVSLLNKTFTEKDPRFEVIQTFPEGRSALEWLSCHPADLLILDVYMPLLTGMELLHELRAREVELDVIMVTAANDAKTVDALFKLGVVDYLVKPFTWEGFQPGRPGSALFPLRLLSGASGPQGPSGEHAGADPRLPAHRPAPGSAKRGPLTPDGPLRRNGPALHELSGRARRGGQPRQLRHRRTALPPLPLP